MYAKLQIVPIKRVSVTPKKLSAHWDAEVWVIEKRIIS